MTEANQCLDISGVSGRLILCIDDDVPQFLKFGYKVKLYLDIWGTTGVGTSVSEISSPLTSSTDVGRAEIGGTNESLPVYQPSNFEDAPQHTLQLVCHDAVSKPNDLSAAHLSSESAVEIEDHSRLNSEESAATNDIENDIAEDELLLNPELVSLTQQVLELSREHQSLSECINDEDLSLLVAPVDAVKTIPVTYEVHIADEERPIQFVDHDQRINSEDLEKLNSSYVVMGPNLKLWPLKYKLPDDVWRQSEIVEILMCQVDIEIENQIPCILCMYCRKLFPSEAHLAAHHRRKQGVKQCEVCKRSFLCEADLFLHELAEHDYSYVVARYPSFAVLERAHCSDLQCALCSDTFASTQTFHSHIQSTHFSDKTYACCVCGQVEQDYKFLRFHMKRKHPCLFIPHGPKGGLKKIIARVKEFRNGCLVDADGDFGENKGSSQPLTATTESWESTTVTTGIESSRDLFCDESNDQKEFCAPSVKFSCTSLKPCTFCKKTFKSKAERDEHTRGPVLEAKCPKCEAVLPSKAELIVHNYRVHVVAKDETQEEFKKTKNFITQCPICSKRFLGSSAVNHIAEVHTKEPRFKCCICGETFSTRRWLTAHLRSHLDPDRHLKAVYHCRKCSQVFTNKSEFHRHAYSHRTSCIFCKQEFEHQFLLDTHQKAEHAHQMFTCEVCGKLWPTATQLHNHMKQHRLSRPQACPVCGVMLMSGLASHILSMHPEYDQYKTTKPGEGPSVDALLSASSSAPSANVKMEDFNESVSAGITSNSSFSVDTADSIAHHESYLCTKCPKTFRSKRSLNDHIRKHFHDRTRKTCPYCFKSFSHVNSLAMHVNSFHTKAKSYVCDICGKKFHRDSVLRSHKETHNQERSFPCRICGKLYKTRASRYKHTTQVHKNSGRVCETVNAAPNSIQLIVLGPGDIPVLETTVEIVPE